MPRLTTSVPIYRKHRASGQAVVTLSGQDFYLGPHGTKTSKDAYDCAVAEWLARGRRPLNFISNDNEGITISELIVAYKRFAESYYRKRGQVTNEVNAIVSAAKFVRAMYGKETVNEFGPLKLQAIQQAMIQADWCRSNINKQISRIVRMFSWGVAQELVRPDVALGLREVSGLHRGRSQARETAPVMPVCDSIVNATLEALPPIVADMVRLQRLTGCRPEEICRMRATDIDISDEVWTYRPISHKTEHHGRERIIHIGPQGQDVLRPYLLRDKEAFCFCPAEGERKRREQMHENRTVPLNCGNSPGTNRRAKPRRPAGKHYSTGSYRRAIHRACETAFGMPAELRVISDKLPADEKQCRIAAAAKWREKHCWSPNRLRHSAATAIRKKFGLEAAQAVLGHSKADITQIYAERDFGLAARVAQQVG